MTDIDTESSLPLPKRRNKRGFHPGVRIRPPEPKNRMPYYRGVFVDPDTGQTVYLRLDPDVYPTAESRKQWAIRKSLDLRAREAAIEDGAPRATGSVFDKLIDAFISDNSNLREGTLDEYKRSLGLFGEWTKDEGIRPDRLRRAHLFAFRVWAMKLPKKQAARKKKRGESIELPKQRSLITVNGDLRVVGTFLRWAIKTERLPRLHLDDLVAGLERYEFIAEPPEFLSRREIKRSLGAAMRHDQVTYVMTRKEKEEGDEPGKTPRFVSIAPFLAAAFLTGMRLDELCLLEWRIHIDLEFEDVDGNAIGQIKLRAQDTKTKRPRFVSFEVSPLLRKLLVALHRKSGGKGSVFNVTYDEAQAANQRLRDDFKAPAKLTYQIARSTCSTFLANAPGIYGAAAAFHAAKQLGHSQQVQEKHYAGLVKGIRPEIRTLEAAMQIEAEVRTIIDIVKGKDVEIPQDDEDDEDA